MIEERLPDCRLRRHDDPSTSARSHQKLQPEKLPCVLLSNSQRKIASRFVFGRLPCLPPWPF